MLIKIFVVNFLILNTQSKTIIKATEKNFPSFVSLTDGKELLINSRWRHLSTRVIAPPVLSI